MFYPSIFDPLLIVYQIVFLQAVFYIMIALPLITSHIILGTELNIDTVYSSTKLSYHTAPHPTNTFYLLLAAYAFTIPVISAFVLIIIGRAKKVLDYVSTLYLIHYIMSAFFAHLPSTIEYYIINITACAATVLLAEYLCVQKEMRTINLSGGSNTTTSTAQTNGQRKIPNELDESINEIEMQSTAKQRSSAAVAKPLLLSV